MSPDLDKKLVEKYPVIFQNRYSDMQSTAMCWGFECGDGWYTLIDNLCAQITHHLKYNAKPETEPFVCDQVKEKFGTLRFYGHGGDERVWAFVWFAENFSGRICETCGRPGKLITNGWYYTACEEHTEEEDKE